MNFSCINKRKKTDILQWLRKKCTFAKHIWFIDANVSNNQQTAFKVKDLNNEKIFNSDIGFEH